jgi:hypothetical protein
VSTILAGVRKGDAALAALLTLLGVLLMIEDVVSSPDPAVRMDSQSWLLIPVFAAATVPILWRRRSMLAVYAVTLAALAVHVLAFGWTVRCGAGLPLAFALAYSSGKLSRGWQSAAGLAASLAVQVIVLVRDSVAGLDIIWATTLIGAVAWGIGVWLRRRSAAGTVAGAAEPAVSYV